VAIGGQLRDWLDGLAAPGGAASAAEAIVADDERMLFRHAAGYRVGGERLAVASGARFDAASLTKPWMATLALALDAVGGLPLDEPIETGAAAPTLADLLRHRAGLPAWTPLAARLGKRLGDASVLKQFLVSERRGASGSSGARFAASERLGDARAAKDSRLGERRGGSGAQSAASIEAARASRESASSSRQRGSDRDGEPAELQALPSQPFDEGSLHSSGTKDGVGAPVVYSDLGYILWGLLAEGRLGRGLGELLDDAVCAPLGLAGLGRRAMGSDVPGAVECRLDNGKEVELAAAQGIALGLQRAHRRGVPQDGNARALRAAGRLGAHAGLFVTADEMLALAREWLRPSRLLTPGQVAAALAGDGDYALGWARWSESGSAGLALSRAAFGHTGFTGGSLWIDPERRRISLLLAHRLASRLDFNPARREFHRLAAAL
jgi:CubicO group peptidase (beta-lactamase class C family)